MNPPTVRDFGLTPQGHPARLFTLRHRDGIEARITNYGGIVTHLLVRDREGAAADVVLGYDSLAPYHEGSPYFGALIGRVGNRIAAGTFTLDGETHHLVTNNEPHGVPCHLHGGTRGFDKVLWEAEPGTVDGHPSLRLRHLSPDGDEGYPGNLECFVTYVLAGDSLRIDYLATCDKATPVNLTNHSYFNLAGEGAGPVLDHLATLRASHFTPVAPGMIPNGEIRPVAGTPFDFTRPKPFGTDIEADDEQIRLGGGFDHNFVIDSPHPGELALAAVVHHPGSGRTMETWTTEPGVQLYTGNSLDGSLTGKSGRPYARRGAFCLETQHFPDSPNQPQFPGIVLEPGKTRRSSTEYRFRAE